ncbi:putative nuclease HARBI1 [Dreissena polymorpha]|uniref:putative nuclease HARBI1 n=1 Tax=Dreissena polymorpha TaxID=45954 RepID=UPI0022654F02|nr:putative nuclease HARBI1 [Dreissena polymorpha]
MENNARRTEREFRPRLEIGGVRDIDFVNRFPIDREDVVKEKRAFYNKCRLPNLVGAVDGTLIPITTPTVDEEVYVCRKGYHAINCQAIVNTSLKFISVVAKWPGSTHDGAVFENSRIKGHLDATANVVLLGDSGYALSPSLLTPIMNPRSQQEERYNRRHKRGREVVERGFGILKSRFRCLHRSGGVLPYKPHQCAALFVACCRLHNLLMDNGEEQEVDADVIEEDDNNDDPVEVVLNQRGAAVRDYYVNLN